MLFLLQGLYQESVKYEEVVLDLYIRKFVCQRRDVCAVFVQGNIF